MSAVPLEDGRVEATIAACRDRLGHGPALAVARAELDACGEALSGRMNVALVGRIKAGKSTLANGLLGGYRAPTGVNELTYNVNWISHGERPTLSVYFKDGRPAEQKDIAELERHTVRAELDDEWKRYLDDIAFLRITDPAPYLRSFDLIDTPGLESVHVTDSDNTLRFLGGPVDALVLVFSGGLQESAPELLRDFQGRGLSMSPINAMAALTKVETYWHWPDVPDPFVEAERVVAQMRGVPEIARLFYRIEPVASLVGAAAATLNDADLADLQALAALPPDRLGRLARVAERFGGRDYDDIPVPPARRAALHRELSGYGIMLACDLLRDGVDDLATLRRELDERSRLAAFRRLLVDHFGNRAELIKLNRVVGRIEALPTRLGPALAPADRVALTDAVREFSRYGLAESARFRELETIRAHYEGRLALSPADAEDMLRATGEHGSSLPARLGMAPDATHEELAAQARARLLRWRTLDLGSGHSGATRVAVSVVMHTYERLISRLEDVRRAEGRR